MSVNYFVCCDQVLDDSRRAALFSFQWQDIETNTLRCQLERCVTKRSDGRSALHIRATPNAKSTELSSAIDGELHIRVAAPPVDDQANEEILKWFVNLLGVSHSSVLISDRTRTSRSKIVHIDLEREQLIDSLIAELSASAS